jgi:hypothetical protein
MVGEPGKLGSALEDVRTLWFSDSMFLREGWFVRLFIIFRWLVLAECSWIQWFFFYCELGIVSIDCNVINILFGTFWCF